MRPKHCQYHLQVYLRYKAYGAMYGCIGNTGTTILLTSEAPTVHDNCYFDEEGMMYELTMEHDAQQELISKRLLP